PVGRQELARRGDAALLLTADADIAADNGLDAGLGGVLREFQGAEEIVAVGYGDRGHRLVLGERHDLVELVRSFGERIGRADFQMDEIGDSHAPLLRSHLVENEAKTSGMSSLLGARHCARSNLRAEAARSALTAPHAAR